MSSGSRVRTDVLRRAVGQALLAPSVHNTQPWRWSLADSQVGLYADFGRHLVGTDPDRRDLVISCGAALHHLRAALATCGLAADVQRLPEPEDSTLLATVRPRHGRPDPQLAELAGAIQQRHTDRRRFSAREVPNELILQLSNQAAANGAALQPVTDPRARQRLEEAIADAAFRQRHAPGYPAELRIWTRRYMGARDGLPPENLPAPVARTEGVGLRDFPSGRLAAPGRRSMSDRDASQLLVLTTVEDTVLDRLRAGEATSAVLLAATRMRLATTPLSQAIEIPETRRRLADHVLRAPYQPQLIIRVGWPAPGAAELPPTPRRPLDSVLVRS